MKKNCHKRPLIWIPRKLLNLVYKITDLIEKIYEDKEVPLCSALILVDKVWNEGQIGTNSSKTICTITRILYTRSILQSETKYSKLKQIKPRVPQGSVLGPFLDLLYTKECGRNYLKVIYTAARQRKIKDILISQLYLYWHWFRSQNFCHLQARLVGKRTCGEFSNIPWTRLILEKILI